MRRLGAIVAVLLFALTTLPAGGAPGDLGVAPGIGIRSTGPGRTVEESVTVVNLSEDDFSVTGSLTDVVVDEKGTFSTVDHGSGLPSAAAWGVVDPATFVLPRGHTQTVKLSFTPPKTTVGGGYYTAARFTGQSGRGTTTSATHAVLLEVAGNALLRAAKIASLSAPERSFGSTIPVSLTLENTGNVYAVAQGRLVVRDQFSRVTAELDIGRTPVVPGTRRVLRINAPPPLIPGRVRVKVELGFGLGVPEDAASTTVYAVAWWHLAAAAVLLLVLIRFIVGLVRGRRRRRTLKLDRRAMPAPEITPTPTSGAPTSGAHTSGAPTARTPASSVPVAAPRERPAPVLDDADLQTSWEPHDEPAPDAHEITLWPEPRVIPRVASAPETEEPVRPLATASAEPKAGPVPVGLEPEPEPEPTVEPARKPEPVTPLVVEREVPVAVPAAPLPPAAVAVPAAAAATPDAVPVPSPVAPAAVAVDERESAAARRARLSEQILAGIPHEPAGGPQATERRVRVAIELLAAGSGRSVESVDVALRILGSAPVDARAAVEGAFDEAVDAGRSRGMSALALAMHKLDSPRAAEALLRAYAAAPRRQILVVRDVLRTYDRKTLRAYPKLLKALPADRKASLKLDRS